VAGSAQISIAAKGIRYAHRELAKFTTFGTGESQRPNENRLGCRRREKEFEKRTDAEVSAIETIVAEEFEDYSGDVY